MAERIDGILDRVDELTDEMVELCRGLVRINTVNPYAGAEPTGLEGPGQEHLRPVMERLGGTTHLFEPPEDIYARMGVLGPKGRCWKGRPNLVTEFDLGDGPTIVVNSHMDTVGVAGMTFDPFCAELRDGVIYGRGTSDDKGGMAMGVTAIRAVLEHSDELAGRIIHQSVADEECNGSGAGTLACIDRGFTGTEAVVVDGGGLGIMRGCQGVLTANLTVHGKSGHAATGGVNAIDKGMIVKQAIDAFRMEREARQPNCLLNIGIFNAGIHPAVVPGEAFLSLNMVYSIAEAAAAKAAGAGWGGVQIREQFEAAMVAAAMADPWLSEHLPEVEWVKDLIPFETEASASLVEAMVEAGNVVCGEPTKVALMDAWADAANLTMFGDTPSVLFGPGTPGNAHSAGETIRVADMVTGAKMLAVYLYNRLKK